MRLRPGQVVWADLGEPVGHEQGGQRPAVVIAARMHAAIAQRLTIVVPCTARDRGWRSHVPVVGDLVLDRPTFAMTEQPRTISHERITHLAGTVDEPCRPEIARAAAAWLHGPPVFRS